jgi:serine phosphatase RsbU (regulator of sigma subunit)
MPGGYRKIMCYGRSLAGAVVILAFFTCGAFQGLAAEIPSDRILHLTPDKNHYFLGPYLAYLEDPQKKLTIEAVSSPQISARFSRIAGRMLNLGLNSSAYWIRFTVDARQNQISQENWLLYLGWPNAIDYATLYIPQSPDTGWFTKEVGRILPTGQDPQPSTPVAFLPPASVVQPVTFFLRVESSEAKILPLQVLTDEAYRSVSRRRSLGFGVYYGLMLAMFLYNLILLISLRELNRFYYLMYLIFMGLLFLESNGLLWEFFQIGIHLGQVLVLIFISLTFFWGNLFAKSFLITRQHAPVFDKLLSAATVLAFVLAAMVPLVNLAWMTVAISIQSIVVPPIFLLSGIASWRRGFRPARFFLLAFAALALSAMYEALVFFGVLPYLTAYSGQFGSAIEVILLQLALADRFRTLSLEHDLIKQSLGLAREVQQNLMPHKNPQMERLDIAGRSLYCDETGGDYYDFITSNTGENRPIGIAIGDVSGHGISSALLMAAVRSSLRQRSTLSGGAGGIISDVNRQLAQDVEDSGQFMTLFYLIIDPAKRSLQWVRAGHDPAIFYDPVSDAFEELGGTGIALGVDENWNFKENKKTGLHAGQIIFLSTDGIWEACNRQREMFGKKPIYDIIRKNSSLSASKILQAVLDALRNFQQDAKIEDDITLVVVKINDESTTRA